MFSNTFVLSSSVAPPQMEELACISFRTLIIKFNKFRSIIFVSIMVRALVGFTGEIRIAQEKSATASS